MRGGRGDTASDASGDNEVHVQQAYASCRKTKQKHLVNSRAQQENAASAGSPRNPIAKKSGNELECLTCGSAGHLAPKCPKRTELDVRRKVATGGKKGEEWETIPTLP